VCCPLLVLWHGRAAVPASLPGCWRPQCMWTQRRGWSPQWCPAACAKSRQSGCPSIPLWVLVTAVQGTQRHGWSPQWCPAACARSRQSGCPASLCGCWRPQCRGLSCLAGPLTGVLPAARAMARQGGGPSIPSWVLVTTV
jgi:hypothetical protein